MSLRDNRPWTNGVIERNHRPIRSMAERHLEDNPDPTVAELDRVVAAAFEVTNPHSMQVLKGLGPYETEFSDTSSGRVRTIGTFEHPDRHNHGTKTAEEAVLRVTATPRSRRSTTTSGAIRQVQTWTCSWRLRRMVWSVWGEAADWGSTARAARQKAAYCANFRRRTCNAKRGHLSSKPQPACPGADDGGSLE